MIKYYLVNITRPQYDGFLVSCDAQHKKRLPDNELSAFENIAGTQAIVKVAGADDIFINGVENAAKASGLIIQEYNKSTHKQIFDFIYSSEWVIPDD